jgi:hypothetical protein
MFGLLEYDIPPPNFSRYVKSWSRFSVMGTNSNSIKKNCSEGFQYKNFIEAYSANFLLVYEQAQGSPCYIFVIDV